VAVGMATGCASEAAAATAAATFFFSFFPRKLSVLVASGRAGIRGRHPNVPVQKVELDALGGQGIVATESPDVVPTRLFLAHLVVHVDVDEAIVNHTAREYRVNIRCTLDRAPLVGATGNLGLDVVDVSRTLPSSEDRRSR